AYFEYSGGETAVGLIDDGVVVLRTFSKSFGLAGARVGYALADVDTAFELNRRQAPAPISNTSAALALAALASPPDVTAEIEERGPTRKRQLATSGARAECAAPAGHRRDADGRPAPARRRRPRAGRDRRRPL